MMKKVVAVIACMLALAVSAQAGESIRINGSGSAVSAMKPLIRAFEQEHPGVRVEMEKPLGSSGALKALIAGMLDIAVSSKQLKPEEEAQGLRVQPYGRTPLLIVTEAGGKRKDITTAELQDIYAGKTRAWRDGQPIRLVLRPREDIDTKILRTLSSGMDQAMTMALQQKGMIVAVTDPEAADQISHTPGALGAAALSGILVDKTKVNILTLDGRSGTVKNLAAGTYPLAKNIDFVTGPKSNAGAAKFISFVLSQRGRELAEKAGVLVTAKGTK